MKKEKRKPITKRSSTSNLAIRTIKEKLDKVYLEFPMAPCPEVCCKEANGNADIYLDDEVNQVINETGQGYDKSVFQRPKS